MQPSWSLIHDTHTRSLTAAACQDVERTSTARNACQAYSFQNLMIMLMPQASGAKDASISHVECCCYLLCICSYSQRLPFSLQVTNEVLFVSQLHLKRCHLLQSTILCRMQSMISWDA